TAAPAATVATVARAALAAFAACASLLGDTTTAAAAGVGAGASAAPVTGGGADAGTPARLTPWAGRADDDADGQPDAEERALPPVTHGDLVPIDKRYMGALFQVLSGAEHARIVLGKDGLLPWNRAVPEPGWFQGISPGRVELLAKLPSGGRQRVT